jgi:hypothetical protein
MQDTVWTSAVHIAILIVSIGHLAVAIISIRKRE